MRYFIIKQIDGIPACTSEAAGISFTLFNGSNYLNRDYRYHNDAFLLDGYTHWFHSENHSFSSTEHFTVSAAFFPATFSAHGDGLFTCYDEASHKGFELCLERGGIVSVNLGFLRFESIRTHVQAGVWNIVTVVFRGYAGWCDLYVNGSFSARKQFRRHTALELPAQPCYIGRRVDGRHFREELPFGCFYGYLKWIDIGTEAPSETEILNLHREVYDGQRDEEAFLLAMPDRHAYAEDCNRPVCHLTAPGKWMNEPHGPMYYNGWYHIFYQANPHAPIWDHLSWGHLRSRDMIHWEDRPPALIPEKEPCAPHGCWSGSSLIDLEGKPRIYYTAGDDRRFPNQAIAAALPESPDDPALDRWYSLPDLIQEQDFGWMGEFRDPFVWTENNTYFMLVGSGDAENGGGNAILYTSEDGYDWVNHGFMVDYDFSINQELGHVWELPVFLPLRDETGAVVSHILLLCACQIEGDIVETYYFMGDWEPDACRFTPTHEKAGLIDLGHGFFTGPSGFVTPDDRSVIFTIAQGKRSFMEDIHAGWAHNGGMPVELSIREGQLDIRPVRELERLRSKLLFCYEKNAAADSVVSVSPDSGADTSAVSGSETSADFHMETVTSSHTETSANCHMGTVTSSSVSHAPYTRASFHPCTRSSELINHELENCCGNTLCLIYTAAGDSDSFASVTLHYGSHSLCIGYDIASRRLSILDENGLHRERFRGEIDTIDIGTEPICFTCYLDHSMLEVYLNGRKSVTLRNYIDNGEKRWFQVDGEVVCLELWGIKYKIE